MTVYPDLVKHLPISWCCIPCAIISFAMSDTKTKKKRGTVTLDDEGGDESSSSSSSNSSSGNDDDDDSSGGDAAGNEAQIVAPKKQSTKKARKSVSKTLVAGLPEGEEPLLSLVTPRDSAAAWEARAVERLTVTKILLRSGVDGRKLHTTADSLAIFQAAVDAFTAKALGNSLLYIHRLEQHSVLTSPITGGPYIEGEQKKAPNPKDIPVDHGKHPAIYQRHISTAIKCDPWISAIVGARTAVPGDVYHPSITIAPPKRGKSD